jgi:hypothetical protein
VDPTLAPPLPRFDRADFLDRGFYLVSQFQDEKRRRDRADAVRMSRLHPSYQCLMTPDNRLMHRNVYQRAQVHLFLELYSLISTWASPELFVMGYPITAPQLLEGLSCFGRMGKTCNPPLTDAGADPLPTYLGCPRASITFQYLHPRAWYALYVPTRPNPKRFIKVTQPAVDAAAHDLHLPAAEQAFQRGLGELERVNQQHCGCPLVHLRRVEDAFRHRLPASLQAGEGIWVMGKDAVGQPSLQPRSRAHYEAFLRDLGLDDLPSSAPPHDAAPLIALAPPTAAQPAAPRPTSSWLDD